LNQSLEPIIIEASMIGIFRIILYVLLFTFIIRLVARLALPYVVKKASARMQDRMDEMQRQRQNAERPEGHVTVEKKSTSSPTKKEDGDFVDYEEVK